MNNFSGRGLAIRIIFRHSCVHSMLRSKTCPATLVDYKEQIQKQKVFGKYVANAYITSIVMANAIFFQIFSVKFCHHQFCEFECCSVHFH